ncbi:SecA DEAD domain containing protein, partial [Asbolus verrucosus]
TTFRTLIPNHLKSFVKNQLHRWIRNAIRAKNDCQELKQYRLMRVNRENTVVPIDYLNTGISMKNMIWSDGLTQFIQLKHHLTLTFENLTSCFISNIGFIKKYDNANIFGLTGTLGSHAEQNLLSNIYRVSYATIPTYKEKRFEERDGYIAETDIVWLLMISSLAIENVDEGRAVLIICETEIDLNNIEYTLNQLTRFSEFNMRKYANENHVEETQKEVKPRDIILATNIAGRGTDFKTSNELEENGGLHVCVTFLPCNQRVEDQAFGRTSRQGKKGTSQLVIRAAEVERLGFNIKNPEFLEIKQKRDDHESNRLKEIENVLVKELDFKDELFERFVNYYKELKKTYKHEKDSYILHDFREYFAYWFQMKNYKGGELNDVTPESEFENFKEDAKEIIAGSIIHNPFNCIAAANYYLQNNVTDEAEKMLNRAIEMSENNLALTYGAYSKLAELKIDKAGQIWKRLRKGLGKFFFMDVKTDDNYKKEALKYMEKSKIALQKEIQVIEDLLGYKRNEDSDTNEVHIKKIENKETKVEKEKVEEVEETAGNSVTDSEEINNDVVTKTVNTYSYNINGRLAVLKSCYEHNELQIKKIKDLKEKDIICDRIVPISIRTFPIGDTFSVRQAVVEITSIGFNTFFILDEIHDIPKEKIHFAQAHLAGGVVAVVAGCAFPPSFFVMSGIGVSLIADAIIDVVFELLSSGKQEFDKKAFLKGKFILYAITLITAGVKIAAQMTKILTKAVQFCRVVSENLRESYPMLSKIFTKLAITIEKYEMLLQTKYVNSLNDNKFTQIWGTSKGVFEEKILPEVLNAGIQRGEEELEKFDNNFTSKSCSRECITFTLKECIHQNSELAKKICTNNLLTINEVVDEFLIENDK